MRRHNFDRKFLYVVLCILIVFVISLSMAYAVLNITLTIEGNTNITAANWDVHLENPIVTEGSVNTNLPTISGGVTASFNADLETMGDFYEFTIDIKNDGDFDAMINSIEKIGLSSDQAKFLNYTIEYKTGISILEKQLLKKNSFVRLKVKVEYRTDITQYELPTEDQNLNLSFKIIYVQSDDTGEAVSGNGRELISFSIYDTVYYALEDMTWGEWVESEYNTDGYYIRTDKYNYVTSPYDSRTYLWQRKGEDNETADDIIISGFQYSLWSD